MGFKLPSLTLPKLSLFGKKSCLAVDIGTSAVKICRLSGGGSRYRIDLWDSLPVPPGLSGKDFEVKAAELLANLVNKHKFRQQPAVFALPAQAVVIRYLTFQGIPREKLEGVVRHEAEGHIPFPLDEVSLDWCEAKKKENGFEVLLVAIKRDKLDSMVSIIEDAGLEVQVVDVTTLALFSLYYHSALKDEKEEDTAEVFVDIGAGTTDIALLKNQRVNFTRSVPIAGRSFTEMIAKRLGIPDDKAEAWKIKFAEVKAIVADLGTLDTGGTKTAAGGLGAPKSPGAGLPTAKSPGIAGLGAPKSPGAGPAAPAAGGLAAPKSPGLAPPTAGGLTAPKAPSAPAAGGLTPPKSPGLAPPAAGGLKPPQAPGAPLPPPGSPPTVSPPGTRPPVQAEAAPAAAAPAPLAPAPPAPAPTVPAAADAPKDIPKKATEVTLPSPPIMKPPVTPHPPSNAASGGAPGTAPSMAPAAPAALPAPTAPAAPAAASAPTLPVAAPSAPALSVPKPPALSLPKPPSPGPAATAPAAPPAPSAPHPPSNAASGGAPGTAPTAPALGAPKPPVLSLPKPPSPGPTATAPAAPKPPAPATPSAPALGAPKPPAMPLPKPPSPSQPPATEAKAAPPPPPPGLKLPGPKPHPPSNAASGGAPGTAPSVAPPDGKSLGAAKADDSEVFGLFESDENVDKEKLSAAVKPIADRLATELRRSFDYFVSQLGSGEIKRVKLSGGGAALKGLAEYLSAQLNVPVTVFDPLAKIQVADSTSQTENPQLYTTAIGMGMRMIDGTPLEIDMMPENIMVMRRMRSMGKEVKMFAAAAILLLGLFGAKMYMTVHNTEVLYKKIQADISELEPVVTKTRQLEKDQKTVNDMEKSIAALISGRSNWLAILTALDKTLPENAAITQMMMPTKEKMEIRVITSSLAEIPEIGRRFQSPEYTKGLFTLANRPNPRQGQAAGGATVFEVDFSLKLDHSAARKLQDAAGQTGG